MRLIYIILLSFSTSAESTTETISQADIQLFGDLWIGWHTNKESGSSPEKPVVFSGVKSILEKTTYNVVNFEGIMTRSFVPHAQKRFLLKMPFNTPELMIRSGINVATLANNHSMDFGSIGLFETMERLQAAGIAIAGSGKNLTEAVEPLILKTAKRSICLLATSRTLPEDFFAKKDRPGTSYIDFDQTADAVKMCSSRGHFTILYVHWGAELARYPKKYQKDLARLAIKNGADVVVGHHPHILQSIEFYQGKPIFYSLGNFAFGSIGKQKFQQGMSVRIQLGPKPKYELIPMNVKNDQVNFVPKLLRHKSQDYLASYLPKNHGCQRILKPYLSWRCTPEPLSKSSK